MKPTLSLLGRLTIGAVLWTAGLVLVVNHISLTIVQSHRINGPSLHLSAMFLLGVGSLIFGLWQVQRGVRSLGRLRDDLNAVRGGTARRVGGSYPIEVQPVVDDLNALLDHQDRAVSRAVAKAGDLAHGMKTPLAIIAQEADRAAAAGQHELAQAVRQQVDRMRRQMDYHLAHARAAASGATPGTRASVAESADGLARTLRRLYAERGIAIDVAVAPDHAVRAGREDLDEMLGNLLDNACKWTRTRIAVSSAAANGHVTITVDDDGPGVAAEMRDQVLRRGVRADEGSPGSGFGLAIVRDLAELYGGSIALSVAPSGGLRATLNLPS
jgi:signal transduction histidine kinase